MSDPTNKTQVWGRHARSLVAGNILNIPKAHGTSHIIPFPPSHHTLATPDLHFQWLVAFYPIMCNAYIPRKIQAQYYTEHMCSRPFQQPTSGMKPSWGKIPILPISPISRMLCIWGWEPQIQVLLIEYRAFTPSAVVITRYCILDPTTSCRKLELDQHIHSTQTHHVALQGPISDRGYICRIYTHPPMSLRGDAERLPRRCGSLDSKSDHLQSYKWQKTDLARSI